MKHSSSIGNGVFERPPLGQELAIYFDDLRSVYPPPKKLGFPKMVKVLFVVEFRVDQLILDSLKFVWVSSNGRVKLKI